MMQKTDSEFKSKFRYYKSKNPPPDYSTVVDPFKSSLFTAVQLFNPRYDNITLERLSLQSFDDWKCVQSVDKPGLFILTNVFDSQAHFVWGRRCLMEYCLPPNKTNLTDLVSHKTSLSDPLYVRSGLRWSAQGYIYNWTDKIYRETDQTQMCPLLLNLSKLIAGSLNFSKFNPDASIINHYFQGSILSGHVDRSEWSMEPPIVSISFGQSCVFLAGGNCLDDCVLPIWLHNGYIMIMSGPQRIIYHGVPRIMNNIVFDDVDEDIDNIIDYINACRINITLRQVKEPT